MTIKIRIFLGFFAFLTLGLIVLTRWLLSDIRPQPLKATEESLVETANLLASLVECASTPERLDVGPLREVVARASARQFGARIYELDKTAMSLRIYVTNARGRVVYDSDGDRAVGQPYAGWNDVARTLRGEYGARATRSDPADFYSTVLYVGAPVRVGGRIVGVVSVGKPVASLKLFMTGASRSVVAASLVAALVAGVASLGIATWIARPLRRLAAYAEAVGRGERPPLPSLGRGEIAALGRAFEAMRDALEGKRYVEDYVRSLTHEIKGPLSAIRAAGELLEEEGMPDEDRRRFLGNIRSECARLQLLVDRLLELAAVEARKSLRTAVPVDVAALVREVVATAEPLARQRELELSAEVGEVPPLAGDELLLRQALFNLVHNALAATPSPGRVTVEARAAANAVEVAVRDTGPGVPSFALPRVFEKFYSLTPAANGSPGTGLGLPFVREVALLHGGEAALTNRPEGGACATLRLPLAPRRGAAGGEPRGAAGRR
ncbi:MAG TPA: two-component system sensor histidine kinase CreC [Thermoanaerobaculaceae bacterium]|nr:two-component system sensor histidine kinase CreC [Thermoanaerobaculaceae bacterium]HRS14798.1 two-component system sensor histidine kinase CreC [Thermoanaerobaculaceae bacterium]